MPEVNVYLVGAGVIAEYHASGAKKLPADVKLHVTDVNPTTLEAFVAKFPEAKAFASLEAMLAAPAHDTDIVIIATPPFAHCWPTIAALESGRHVLCEKPLAMNRDEAWRMLSTARKARRSIACCSCRFLGLAAMAEVKQLIASGQIGRPYHITWINRRARNRSGIEYQPQSRWFLDPAKSGGGCLMDWGPYDFAAMSELLEPTRMDVRSTWLATPKTGNDPKEIELTTEQHAAASLLFTRIDGQTIPVTYERAACTNGHETNVIEIEGERGSIRWDWLGQGKVHFSRDVSGKVDTTTTEHPDKAAADGGLGPHDKPIGFFYRHLLGQNVPAIVNERALFNFSCIRAVYDAASTGRPQTVVL